uniref:Uncharacterized protein n=1 Tax=Globodera rostochiensis TaxID=31243 RepID=A0A914GZY7_GLORO
MCHSHFENPEYGMTQKHAERNPISGTSYILYALSLPAYRSANLRPPAHNFIPRKAITPTSRGRRGGGGCAAVAAAAAAAAVPPFARPNRISAAQTFPFIPSSPSRTNSFLHNVRGTAQRHSHPPMC